MLTFLHTAPVHVDTFGAIAREVDDRVPLRHEVHERLLVNAAAAGAVSDPVRSELASVIRALANEGATLIVCTCSTLGGAAEQMSVPGCPVMRIDRPMAEQAVASGRRVVVLAALPSTLRPTRDLLHGIAAERQQPIQLVEILCESAWSLFERGDVDGYAAAIGRTIEATALPDDVVVLAQASMAPAAALVAHLGIPISSSPRSGVEAAISEYWKRVRCSGSYGTGST